MRYIVSNQYNQLFIDSDGKIKTKNREDIYKDFVNINDKSRSAFATVLAGQGKKSSNSFRNRKESDIKRLLEDPTKNAVEIAEQSGQASIQNGIYKTILKYLSSILTFDHMLYPIMGKDKTKIEDLQDDKTKEAYFQNAYYLDKLNIKYHAPQFLTEMNVKGAVFLYKIEDDSSVEYIKLKESLCRIIYQSEGVFRYAVDLSKITSNDLVYLPIEILNAYERYGKGNKNDLIDDTFYIVSDKGMAFTLDSGVLIQNGYSLPPLAHSIPSVSKLEKYYSMLDDLTEIDNSKLIHSQIPLNKDGFPVIGEGVATQYANSIRREMPQEGLGIAVTPFSTNVLEFEGTGTKGTLGIIDKHSQNLYEDAGVSSQLFSGENTSAEALNKSIQVDTQWLFTFVLPQFANYYNYELKQLKNKSKKNVIWKIKFLNVTYFSRDTSIKVAKDQLSFGGSRLEYLAYMGMTPSQIYSTLFFEQNVLDIDSIMVSKETSYTKTKEGDEGKEKDDKEKDVENIDSDDK